MRVTPNRYHPTRAGSHFEEVWLLPLSSIRGFVLLVTARSEYVTMTELSEDGLPGNRCLAGGGMIESFPNASSTPELSALVREHGTRIYSRPFSPKVGDHIQVKLKNDTIWRPNFKCPSAEVVHVSDDGDVIVAHDIDGGHRRTAVLSFGDEVRRA